MASRIRVVRWIPLSLLLLAAGANGAERAPGVEAAITRGPAIQANRAEDPKTQIELSSRPAWRAFRARYGDWRVTWNEVTGTPHRAFGRSIPLPSFANEAGAVDRAVRAFIAENGDLLGTGSELETVSSSRAGGVWYVRYRQTLRGLPVLFSDWEFRVGDNGRLMAFGVDARTVPANFDPTPRIVAAVAREAGRAGLTFDPTLDEIRGGDELGLLPVRGSDGGTELRPVYSVVAITHRPRGSWLSLVDAQTGDVLWRQSLLDHAVTGRVTAAVHISLPSQTLTTRSLADAYVNVGTVQVVTDTAGNYSATPPTSPVTLTTSFQGPFCRIARQDAADASFNKNGVANPSVQNVAWTHSNSDDAEKDCFYHVNLAHDHVKAIDPSYTANDYQMLVNVNIMDGGECAAEWDAATNSLNFYPEGTCPNTGTMPDIIWHEYAHSISYNLYFSHGRPYGIANKPLAEGLADAFCALMDDDPIIGNGFNGVGTYLRNLVSTAHWPEDATGSSHDTGVILASAIWDLRTAIGLATTNRIYHFAKYGLADDTNAGIAMNEYFVDLLVADDDDANLGNGTPHMSEIIAAFNAHGIGTNFFITATHAPLDDQLSNGPFPITATIQYNGPIGSFSSATLYYKFCDLPFEAAPMLATGNPDEYGAEIPHVPYGLVNYYIVLQDSYGGAQVLPPGAPARGTYQFIAGPATTLLSYDMETAPGWTVGAAGDNATSGIWERVVPFGTMAQPGEDHSLFGTQCYVTGNTTVADPPGLNDVDGGKTTLVTSVFNAHPAGTYHPIITYWRWVSNDTGDYPGEDPWQVDISSNGGTSWVPIENTTVSSNAWQRVSFLVEKYVTPTSNMKMRFVAQDILNPSLVEAAVDDWSLVAYTDVSAVDGSPVAASLALAPAAPNPFRQATRIRYSLPVAGRVELRVFDVHGRAIRTLAAGEEPAGTRTAEWNGRDDNGRLVASGPYFVRLSQAGKVQSHAVVVLH